MSTPKYALFGQPVALSPSPQIHQQFAESLGEQIQYDKFEISEENFPQAVADFFNQGGLGLNITVPHKQTAFDMADMVSTTAQQAGAANTLWMIDGRLHADNTDGKGFIKDLQQKNISVKNKTVLILGAGGAVRGILGPLLLQSPEKIILVNRSEEKASTLSKQFSKMGDVIPCSLSDSSNYPVDIVINGLSLHQFPQALIFNLNKNSSYYDLKYGKAATSGIDWASQQQFKIICDGWGMLLRQAAESYFIWRGKKPDVEKISRLIT